MARPFKDKEHANREAFEYLYIHANSLAELSLCQFAAELELDRAGSHCYFGRLDQVFQGATKSLRPGGALYFTVEGAGEEIKDFHLESSGRYLHATKYVRQMLKESGFAVKTVRSVVLHKEAKEPVFGILMLARKAEE